MIKPPDAKTYNPDPAYLRALLQKAGVTQDEAALAIGIAARTLRRYLSDATDREVTYPVQFALECLAAAGQARDA